MEKKADFKTMKKSEIIGFIWDYYKWHIIVGVFVIMTLVSLIRHIVSLKATVVQMTLINCNITEEDGAEELDFSEFMERYGYNPKKEEVSLNTGYDFSMDSTSTRETELFQSCFALTIGGGVDVLVADDEELYQFMGENYMLASLIKYLPEDILQKYEEDLIYAEINEEQQPVGICVGRNTWLLENGLYQDECCIGIASGSKREEEAVQLFRYLLGEE